MRPLRARPARGQAPHRRRAAKSRTRHRHDRRWRQRRPRAAPGRDGHRRGQRHRCGQGRSRGSAHRPGAGRGAHRGARRAAGAPAHAHLHPQQGAAHAGNRGVPHFRPAADRAFRHLAAAHRADAVRQRFRHHEHRHRPCPPLGPAAALAGAPTHGRVHRARGLEPAVRLGRVCLGAGAGAEPGAVADRGVPDSGVRQSGWHLSAAQQRPAMVARSVALDGRSQYRGRDHRLSAGGFRRVDGRFARIRRGHGFTGDGRFHPIAGFVDQASPVPPLCHCLKEVPHV